MDEQYLFPGRATAPGSSRYYAVRIAPEKLRDHLALIFKWQWELQEIYFRCSDTGIALTKLQWYRDEFSRALAGEAEHPLLKRVAETIATFQLPQRLFLKMADAVEEEIRGWVPQHHLQLSNHCSNGYGSLFLLLTRICGGDIKICGESGMVCAGDQRVRICADKLGTFVRLASIIRDFGQDLRQGSCFLPSFLFEKYDLKPERLLTTESETALHTILKEQVAIAKAWHTAAIARLPEREERPPLAPALALAASHERLLSELEKSGFNVLTERMSLTPLRKLWISWRIHRKYR